MRWTFMYSNSSAPSKMPSIEAGTSSFSSRHIQWPRKTHSAIRSITQRIGSKIAAAVIGDTTRAIKGTATMTIPPPKPPLAIPNIRTAGIAAK